VINVGYNVEMDNFVDSIEKLDDWEGNMDFVVAM